MHLRLHKKHLQLISLDEVDTSPEQPPMRREYPQDDLHLTGALDRITLSQAVAKLPRGYRTVFLLHDVQGYQHHEVARIMQLSVGNSKSQLHKARRSLRARLRRNDRKPRRAGLTRTDQRLASRAAGWMGE